MVSLHAQAVETDRRRFATLPNCDHCGRFTSNPTVVSGCISGGGHHACWEWLLCPTCATKEADS